MKERIQELAEQAKEHARKYVADCQHYGYYLEHNEYDIRFEKKFAELIVQECARVSERTGALNEADYEGEMIADSIREHFGVEE